MGYLLDRVQNGGACGCGLSPSLPMAWQREQFFSNSISPLLTRFLSTAKTWLAATLRIVRPARSPATKSLQVVAAIPPENNATLPCAVMPQDAQLSSP